MKYDNLIMLNMKKLFKNWFTKQVFISYARKDKEYVESFIKNGQNRGFEIFVDETDKQPGSNWKERILDKIHYSDAAFLFISKNSLREDSPIRELEIPQFIYQNNIKSKRFGLFPKNKFQFFPVFIDYVDQDVVDNFNFKSLKTEEFEKLFTNYDIWNLEANDKSYKDSKIPSTMSEDELNAFWAELNLQMTNAVKGRKITKMGSIDSWSSNRKDATQYIFNSIKRIIGYIFLISVIGYLLFLNSQESDQTSEVFNIGLESVRIAALNTGDCFDLVNKDEEIGWNTYVQYRACDLLHDGEVFYRENQLDFGDNQVSYTNLLNLFTQTCNSEFSIYQNSTKLPKSYEIQYYWDTESQALGTKPFDMLCLTLYENRTTGSYVEDITGISILLPNPGNKYDCDDFDSKEDAQIWFDLYFDDYGDVALLDINNNGVACDEIRSNETSIESEETTITTLETSTTTTTLPTQTNVENTVQSFEDIGFNLNDAVRNSKNKEALTNYFDIPNRASSWSNFSGLRIETHWKTGILLKWNGCDYTMGCIYKLSINDVNFGSHFYDGTYYTTNNNIFIGGINESATYEIKLEPVDAMYQTYPPVYLRFNGSDWTTDDSFNPGWPLVNEVGGFKIYADQNNWKPPQSTSIPKISIGDQGSSYGFTLLEWDITRNYTHSLLFADNELIGILGNIPPQFIQLEKSLLADQTLNGKTITLIAFDSPVMPGASYVFEYSD
jgi:hypothetical protein